MSQPNTGQSSTAAGQQPGQAPQGSNDQCVNLLNQSITVNHKTSITVKNIAALWKCCVPVFQFLLRSVVKTQNKEKRDNEPYLWFIKRVYPGVNLGKINRNIKKQLEEQTSCDTFDVPLIYALLPVLCDGIESPDTKAGKLRIDDDSTFEHWFKRAKDLRNNLQHERETFESDTYIKDLEEALINLLEKSKNTLDIVADEVDEMTADIKKTFLGINNLPMDGKTLMLLSDILNAKSFKADAKKDYEENDIISIASVWLNREDIFFPITLKVKSNDDKGTYDIVDYDDILRNLASSFLIITGGPGSGKTIMMRTLFKSWLSQDEEAATSEGFHPHVAVNIVCRDQEHARVVDRLKQLYPSTFTASLDEKIMKKALGKLSMMILVDGYDELNESSRQLMEDVLSYQNTYEGRMRVIVTSRPEAAAELTKKLGSEGISWQEATMAPVNDNIDFVGRYEKALEKKGTGQGLVEAFKTLEKDIKNIFNTPVLLTLFVKLYMNDKESVKRWRTEHDILCIYIEMIRKEIIERVKESKDDQGNTFRMPTALGNDILQSVGSLALKMHANEKMRLSEREYLALISDESNPLYKLGEETFRSVLSCVLTPQEAGTGTESHYQFGHITFQEVLAAMVLEEKLGDMDTKATQGASQAKHGRNTRQEGFLTFFTKSNDRKVIDGAEEDDGAEAFKTTIKELTGVEVTNITRYANIVKYVTLFLNKPQKLRTHGPILAGVLRVILREMRWRESRDYCMNVIATSGHDEGVAELVMRAAKKSGAVKEWEGWDISAVKHMKAASMMLLRLKQQLERVKRLRVDVKEALTAEHWTALGELMDVTSQHYSHVEVDIRLHHSYEECVPADGLVKKMKGIEELSYFKGCVAEEESLLTLRDWQWYVFSSLYLSTPAPGLLHLLGGSDGRCGAEWLYFTVPYTGQGLPAGPLPVDRNGNPPALLIKGCPEDAQQQQLIDLIVKLTPKWEMEYGRYEELYLTHCGLTEESVEAVRRGIQQRHVRTLYHGNTRAECLTKDDGTCDAGYRLLPHTHRDGTACWQLYSQDTN